MLSIKHTVRVLGLKPEVVMATIVADQVFAEHGFPCIITSITDGNHMAESLHHAGLAVDFRTKHISSPDTIRAIAEELQTALGPEYDVVYEVQGPGHLHVEYDNSK